MPFTAPHLLWKEDYIKRENELKEYMKYVPPSKEHEEVWSLELANQLLLIGSSIDSFFKRAIRELLDSFFKNFQIGHHQSSNYSLFLGMRQLSERLEKSETKKSVKYKGRFLNMGDYRDIFEAKYHFSERKISVLITQDTIQPFEGWGGTGSVDWWNAYTDIKHSRFRNRKSATLKSVIDALAALFLLNVYYPANRKYLATIDVIEDQLKEKNKHNLMQQLEKDYINTTGLFTPVAQTEIFAYIFSDEYDWYKHNEQWKLLDPYNIYGFHDGIF